MQIFMRIFFTNLHKIAVIYSMGGIYNGRIFRLINSKNSRFRVLCMCYYARFWIFTFVYFLRFRLQRECFFLNYANICYKFCAN